MRINFIRAFRVWQRHWTVHTKLYKSSFALNFAEPVLYLVAFGMGLGVYVTEINGMPYIRFIAPGIIASSSVFAAVYECSYGTYVRMEFQRTFDAILATPVGINDLVAGELLWGATKSVIYGASITLVVVLFGLVDSFAVILVIPVIFLGGIIFAELSLIFAALVPGIDSFSYFFTLFMTPLFLFSGIFFPLDVLPHMVGKIASFTPLYHLVTACRGLAAGALAGILLNVFWLAAMALLLAPFPFRLMRKRVIH
ncbi:MAG: ABC transporter permease [Nitrospirae bacterium GWC2_57_13]|nr:MAG: ABC transporter permease [Nitrospirae bacterium GWC2_57_13]OGW45523.1 MAG: ABC transporter permease [Nitrospirae bacterium GWD2_57_8]